MNNKINIIINDYIEAIINLDLTIFLYPENMIRSELTRNNARDKFTNTLYKLKDKINTLDKENNTAMLIFLQELNSLKCYQRPNSIIHAINRMIFYDKMIIIKPNIYKISILDILIKFYRECKYPCLEHKGHIKIKKILNTTSLFITILYYIRSNSITYPKNVIQKYPQDVRKYL